MCPGTGEVAGEVLSITPPDPDAPAATGTQPPKKRRRPPLSCEQCRARKIRCDRNSPCNHCIKSRLPSCSYAPLPPSAPRRQHGRPVLAPREEREQVRLVRSVMPVSSTSDDFSTSEVATYSASTTSPEAPKDMWDRGRDRERERDPRETPDVDWLRSRILHLEDALARTSLTGSRDGGPVDGMLELKDGDGEVDEFGQTVRFSTAMYTMSKSRYFGQTHFLNVKDLFPVECCVFARAERGKGEPAIYLQRCKRLARLIKANRLQPGAPSAGVLSTPFQLCREMPPRPLADKLVDAYLRTFEGVFRILHVPTFRADLERYWTNPGAATEVFLVQLQLVMALGVSVSHSLDDPDFPSLRARSVRWIMDARIWLVLPPDKARMTIAGVQVLCLLHLAKVACGAGQDLNWVSAGGLIRTAMYVGLHRDPKRLGRMTRLRAEMRRRLWATVLELNLQASFDSGASPVLSGAEYDTKLPGDFDDGELDGTWDDEDERPFELEDEKRTRPPTQTTAQLALMQSHGLRTSLLRHANDSQTRAAYDETLRLNSDLTKACRSLTKTLTYLSEVHPDGALSRFHISSVELLAYRCFHALHQPVMARSLTDPRYFFSRKMCLDSALKIADMYGLGSSNGSMRDADFRRLADNSSGVYRDVAVQAIFSIGVAQMKQRDDEASIRLGYLPSVGPADLRSRVAGAVDWMLRRVRAGQTNVKTHVFLAAGLAHTDALAAEVEDVEGFIMERITESVKACWDAMNEAAAREGVVVPEDYAEDYAEERVEEMEMVDADVWPGDWAWADLGMDSFTKGVSASYDGPLFDTMF